MPFGSTEHYYAAVTWLLLVVQLSLACRCSGPTNTITSDFMKVTDAIGRFYIDYGIGPRTGMNGNLYYVATAYKWFKGGDIGLGKLFVKTSANASTCGVSVTIRSFSVLFGTIRYESVPGFAGTVPTLTIDSCKPQKVASTISKQEWNTLLNYKKENKPGIVCQATACNTFRKPTLSPLTCPQGHEYTESAVCEGQVNNKCGWSVTGFCKRNQ